MLRHTIDRAEMLIQPERLLTIVSKQHSRYVHDQLSDRPSGTVIVQPAILETGPAILYLLLHVYQRDPEAKICLFPSDHFILNEQSFMKHIEFSSKFVGNNPQAIVLLGVPPQQPETGYGWIVTGEQIVGDHQSRAYPVSRFVEKPNAFIANQLFREGSLWNTMIIVCKAKTVLASFKMFTPAMYQAFWGIRSVLGSSIEAHAVAKVYATLSPVNFSCSILEKNPVGLRAVSMQGVYWNDWGDAAHVQSDMLRFCEPKYNSVVPLPFTETGKGGVRMSLVNKT